MDDFLFALTGAILQVLGLTVAVGNLMIGAVGLAFQLAPKEKPRSSQGDEPEQH